MSMVYAGGWLLAFSCSKFVGRQDDFSNWDQVKLCRQAPVQTKIILLVFLLFIVIFNQLH